MKILVACLALPLVVAAVDAVAQADPMERLRACSTLAPAERAGCFEKLSHDIGPPPTNTASAPAAEARPAADNWPADKRAADEWIVSQTTSPFDYSPIAIATASASGGPNGAALQLSIQCRGGSTELVLASAPPALRGGGTAVAYSIDDGSPVPLATGPSASGTGLAIKGDVVRLLAALPDHGTVTFRIAAATPIEGRYALASLSATLKRLAGPCKWPSQ